MSFALTAAAPAQEETRIADITLTAGDTLDSGTFGTGYTFLKIYFWIAGYTGGGSEVYLRVNDDSGAAHYEWSGAAGNANQAGTQYLIGINGDAAPCGGFVSIVNPGTGALCPIASQLGAQSNAASGGYTNSGIYVGGEHITRIQIIPNVGVFNATSRIVVMGVK